MDAVTVRDVRKDFGGTTALAGVDLRVAQGEVVGLLGPNGAGKTTLVRVLATLLQPDSGTAEIFGLDVVQHAAEVRHLIGLTGQYAAIDGLLTGRENLEMFGELLHLPIRELVGLLEVLGGEQQGRALGDELPGDLPDGVA